MAESQDPSKLPITESKLAYYWKLGLYVFSAGMMAKALAGFSEGIIGESIGNIGLSLIFVGMCFRSREITVLSSFSDPVKRHRILANLRKEEKKERPWISWIVRAGWTCLVLGLFLELSNSI